MSLLLQILLINSFLVYYSNSYSFSEELLVDLLPNSFVQFHFQFKSDLEKNNSNFGNFFSCLFLKNPNH